MRNGDQALNFECEGDALLGVLSLPEAPAEIGIVIVVGGPQYRAGSHRQFVVTARRMAAAGFAVLRFDYRGMGDSEGAPRAFDRVDADIQAAILALRTAVPAVRRVVLWGLCDGASAALMRVASASLDADVAGVCLLNPWVRSAETLARTHVRHYYRDRLRQREFWLKLARGGVAWQAVKSLIGNLRTASRAGKAPAGAKQDEHFIDRMSRAWRRFPGAVMLVLSEDDITANEFRDSLRDGRTWARPRGGAALRRLDIPAADHTLSDPRCLQACDDAVIDWLRSLPGARPAPAAGAHASSRHEVSHAS